MDRVQRGDRVELEWTDDAWTKLRPGDQGTVGTIDSQGTVHVNWDSGARLGLVRGHDRYRKISEE